MPDADGDAVEEIRITRQAELAPGVAATTRWSTVKGLECWPSTPRLRAARSGAGARCCSRRTSTSSRTGRDWPQRYEQAFGRPLPSVTLKRGVDFDKVVFGASVASVESLAPQLVERSARARRLRDEREGGARRRPTRPG